MNYPKAWAEHGDGTTRVSHNVREALGLGAMAIINSQGGKRKKPFVNFEGKTVLLRDTSDSVKAFVEVNPPDGFVAQMHTWREQASHVLGGLEKVVDPEALKWCNEWVALSTHWESYPSGGSVEYATYAYFDGEELHTGGQLSLGPQWGKAQFYRIER
jgi:hypothetical protein